MIDYYLILTENKVVGYFNYSIEKKYLDENQELIKITTVNPDAYIGLLKSQIYEDPLPMPTPDESFKDTQQWKRSELQKLFWEIKFTEQLSEDATELQAEYDRILADYTQQKSK